MDKKLTFAQRANKIKNKYKSRPNDPMSIEAMERELMELSKEQEAYKKANGFGDVQNSFSDGGTLSRGNKNDVILDYNTDFQYKTSEGTPFYVTRYTTSTAGNPAFKEFSPGYVYFEDKSLIPDYGNIKLADYDKTNKTIHYMSDNLGYYDKSKLASQGKLPYSDLGNFKCGGKLSKYTNGGGLPKYELGDVLLEEEIIPDEADVWADRYSYLNMGATPKSISRPESATGVSGISSPNNLTIGKQRVPNLSFDSSDSSDEAYSPSYNWISPTASTATNILSNYLSAKSDEKQKNRLLNLASQIKPTKVSAQKIDLGRQKSDVRGLAGENIAAGNLASRGASSAAERANIANAARLASTRQASEQLGRLTSQEEMANAQYRNQAEMYNANEKSRADRERVNYIMGIESQYGDPMNQMWANTIKSTGQNYINAYDDYKKKQDQYNWLSMLNDNYYIDKSGKIVSR